MNRFGKLLVKLGAELPPDNDFYYAPVPGGSYLGGNLDARRITAFYACVNLLADVLASLDRSVYRTDGETTVALPKHPLNYVLNVAPNPTITAHEFWHLCMQDLCIWGNFYARPVYDSRGNLYELYPIPAWKVNVWRDLGTRLVTYSYSDYDGTPVSLLADEIFHIPALGYDGVDQLTGLSCVNLHRRSLGLADDADSYGANYFRNNATPPAYIYSPNTVKDTQKQGILDYFLRTWGGVKNAGKMGILDNGMELKTVPVNHRDMQFLELRQYQVEDIARIVHRVPLHLIQHLLRSTNNNIEHQGIDFNKYTMGPICERIENRIRMQLMGPREGVDHFMRFNLDSIDRGDALSRAEADSARINSAQETPNEVRRRNGKAPLPGGDQLYIQGAMVPLEMAGQQLAAKEVVQ
jgi:HK97 family phage portal protein